MSAVLVLPLRLDALWLRHPASATGPLADYSVLPWVDRRTGEDRNPDRPFLADEVSLPPFETRSGLEPGVHLHWTLPEAMRRATHPLDPSTGLEVPHRVEFPRVPDRWLVSRAVGGVTQQRWLVFSDYLWPAEARPPAGTITAALPEWRWAPGQPRARHLGRVVPLPAGSPLPTSDRAGWEAVTGLPLTVVGPWEDPSFAALYPNCRNLFGLHDTGAASVADGATIRYEVIGWYADAGRDLIAETVTHGARQGRDAAEFLRDRLHLEVQTPPDRSVCFGRLELTQPTPARPSNSTVRVAMGNSPTEALIAHLAESVDQKTEVGEPLAERCLQALRVNRAVDGNRLDLGPRLAHALHQEGFQAVAGGTRWRVVRRRHDPAGSGAAASRPPEINLPGKVAHVLETLSQAQHELDEARWALEWEAEQLYCDWYRTVRAAYRPNDVKRDMPDLDLAIDWLRRRGGLDGGDDPASLTGREAALAAANSVRDAARAALESEIADHNEGRPVAEHWSTLQVPSTRYWRPTEPAVMLASTDDDDAISMAEFGAPLAAPEVVVLSAWDPAAIAGSITGDLGAVQSAAGHNALLLEWRVEIAPLRAGGQIAAETRHYQPDWISAGYALGETEQDLIRRGEVSELIAAGSVHQGRCLLTPSGAVNLRRQIEEWLGRWIARRLEDWRTEADLAEDFGSGEVVTAGRLGHYVNSGGMLPETVNEVLAPLSTADRQTFLDWVSDHEYTTGAAHPSLVLLAALEELETREGGLLGQSLGGLNRALLGLDDGPALSMDDPLGFTEYRQATIELREAIGAALTSTRGYSRPRTSPRPHEEFVPIRSGALRLLGLRLVDAFGRSTELSWDELERPAAMASSMAGRVALPPRFCQAARLRFRWLAAEPAAAGAEVDVESNDHPATSPVCGWLVADHLDRGVLVFDAAGKPLGGVAPPGRWRPPPGGPSGTVRPDDIPNPFLRETVSWLVEGARGEGFLDAFLDAVEAAVEAIEPEDYHQHEALALLASRPLAVVRSRIELELRGPSAVDQGWHAFRGTIGGQGRTSCGLEEVELPVRVGEHRMLDDGVVGFFVEDDDGLSNNRLYCPQGLWAEGGAGDPRIVEWREGDAALNIKVRAAGPPVTLTMLVDPRGRVHATSGVLPTRSLTIPSDQYRDTLGRIALWFQVAPLLSGAGDLEVDLPDEPGWRWSWVARAPAGWERNDVDGYLSREDLDEQTWSSLVAAGKLRPDPLRPGFARWVHQPGAASTGLPDGLAGLIRDRIVPAPRRPAPGPTAAREGWLVLRHTDDAKET